jgi:hypothetical protein
MSFEFIIILLLNHFVIVKKLNLNLYKLMTELTNLNDFLIHHSRASLSDE